MFKKTMIRMGFLILSLFIWGCVATPTSIKPSETISEQLPAISTPDRMIVDLSRQPAHVKLVLAALVNKLRDDPEDIPEVVFDPQGAHEFYDANFTYDGFDLSIVQITGFEILNQTETEAQLLIEGIFSFRDLFGRGVSTYYAAGYTVHNGGINITRSGTALIAPAIPNIETFYVPKSSFDGVDMKTLTSYMDLYLHAVLNAFDMEPTREERQNKEAYDNLSVFKKIGANAAETTEECYIMAFCKNRLPWEAFLEMKVTGDPQLTSQPLFETGYVYDQGWRIMIAGGVFSPNALKDNLYVNVLYNTNPELKSEPLHIGSYINQKKYDNTSKYNIKPFGTTTHLPLEQPHLNPIESGEMFLNPGDPDDARQIQTLLAEKGYYKMKIDGNFGPGSRKALKQFKMNNGLGDDTVWDLNTQKVLFENSGL